MQCNSCGTQLAEGELTCPRCGTSVDGVGQHYTANKTAITASQTIQQQPQPIPVQQVQQPPVSQGPAQLENQPKGTGRKILIFLILIALITLLSIMFYSVILNKKDQETKKEPPSTEEKVPTSQENIQEYGGYTFTIPEGYQSKISNLYGLVIYNKEEAYSITVDYTNPYETRKTTFMTHFPDQANTLVANIANREYLVLVIPVQNAGYATQYATQKTEKATFVGLVAKADHVAPGAVEFTKLTSILDSAEQKETVIPGTTNDAGVTGIQVYTVDFNEFFPSTQETQTVQPTQ